VLVDYLVRLLSLDADYLQYVEQRDLTALRSVERDYELRPKGLRLTLTGLCVVTRCSRIFAPIVLLQQVDGPEEYVGRDQLLAA
jgi:hypothetical protein